MGILDTRDLSSGYLAYLEKAASVFCRSLSQPGPVPPAYEVRRGAQYSTGSVVYHGQTRQHCVYIAPEKIGYVPCFCDGCGDTQVWVVTNIVYAQIAHDSQGVVSLGLENLYPVLPSETFIYFCCGFFFFFFYI